MKPQYCLFKRIIRYEKKNIFIFQNSKRASERKGGYKQ